VCKSLLCIDHIDSQSPFSDSPTYYEIKGSSLRVAASMECNEYIFKEVGKVRIAADVYYSKDNTSAKLPIGSWISYPAP
jgi:hypothetical protein